MQNSVLESLAVHEVRTNLTPVFACGDRAIAAIETAAVRCGVLVELCEGDWALFGECLCDQHMFLDSDHDLSVDLLGRKWECDTCGKEGPLYALTADDPLSSDRVAVLFPRLYVKSWTAACAESYEKEMGEIDAGIVKEEKAAKKAKRKPKAAGQATNSAAHTTV